MINSTNPLNSTGQYAAESISPKNKPQGDSAFLQMLSDRFNNADSVDSGQQSDKLSVMKLIKSGSFISANVITESVGKDLAAFHEMFDSALEEAGIAKNPPFEVRSDVADDLYITSDNPNKDAIEKILNEVPSLW